MASHVTAMTLSAALEAIAGLARLLTVAIDGARLNTSLASCAILIAVTLAVLVTPEVCCAVLLTVATVTVLITLFFSSDYHLLASTQLWDKDKAEIYYYHIPTVRSH